MPLYVSGQCVTEVPRDIVKFVSTHSDLAKTTERLKLTPSQEFGEVGLLYVAQREFAVVTLDAENIDILGTDDATTCHIVIVKHTGSGAMCLGHLDGLGTKQAVHDMVKKTKEQSYGGPEGRLEVHVIGGFIDDQGASKRLTHDIFRALINLEDSVHLRTACISTINDTVRQGIHYPIIYGIAVKIKTGEMLPATFLDKGPDADIRSAANFTGNNKVRDIFKGGLLTVGPFVWFPEPLLLQFISAPDKVIRNILSTSPDQEPPYFEEHIRQCLCILRDHPEPQKTLFPNFHPRLFKKNAIKLWTLIAD